MNYDYVITISAAQQRTQWEINPHTSVAMLETPVWARRIHDDFLELAQRAAECRLNKNLRHRISISEVVNSAMKSALSDVRNQRIENLDSHTFESRLRAILSNKIVSRVRHATAEKTIR